MQHRNVQLGVLLYKIGRSTSKALFAAFPSFLQRKRNLIYSRGVAIDEHTQLMWRHKVSAYVCAANDRLIRGTTIAYAHWSSPADSDLICATEWVLGRNKLVQHGTRAPQIGLGIICPSKQYSARCADKTMN